MDPSQPSLPPEEQDEVEALETPEINPSSVETNAVNETNIGLPESPNSGAPVPQSRKQGLKQILRHFNIYLLLFTFVLLIAIGILMIAYFQSKKYSTASTLKAQDLSQSTLQQLAASDATIGTSKQVLSIQSSTIFAGKVLARDGLEVAGNVNVSGVLATPNLTVSGTSQLGQTQVNKDLAVAGGTAIQGVVTIAKSLQVSSGGTFGGPLSAPQITTSSLQLNGDLILTHHISAGGPTPSLSKGSALGSGGTASISGSDISGSVSINVGSSAGAGCFATVNFTSKYNATPHVLLTPVGASAGGLAYYVTRTTTSFSVCAASTPTAGTSFGFDYFVTE